MAEFGQNNFRFSDKHSDMNNKIKYRGIKKKLQVIITTDEKAGKL